jgi:hypothetical protein
MSQATFVTVEEALFGGPPTTDGVPPILSNNVYFGIFGTATSGPQGFRTHTGPNKLTPAHFHHTDQFQVFLGAADTKFERKLAGPLLLHYADGDTLYGPFSSGELPFTFFTLRKHGSDFQGHMPEDKAEMSHNGAKRHYSWDMRDWLGERYPPTGEAVTEVILEPRDNNLAAFKITAGGSAKVTGPEPKGSGGQYYVVIEGELIKDGKVLRQHTLGWVNADDEPPVLSAGIIGARLLVLQFGSES